jgi:hypothetical protein
MASNDEAGWGWVVFLLLIGAFTVALLTSVITAAVHGPFSYSTGFCTALDGTRLNNETCDVGGKVVTVTYNK